jgi:hypothetical protein
MAAKRAKARKRIRNRIRLKTALDLRTEGLSFEEIGKRLVPAVSRQRAQMIVRDALRELNEDIAETADEIRRVELERLDDLIKSLWPGRKSPRVTDSILRIGERRAKLTGIDAPTRLEQSGPGGGPMEYDLSKCSIEELRALVELLDKARTTPQPEPTK